MSLSNIQIALEPQAIMPVRKNPEDAGLDIFSPRNFRQTVLPGKILIIPTFVYIITPKGYVTKVENKSKKDYLVLGGVVDHGYPNQIYVKIVNPTDKEIEIWPAEAIAQLLIQKVELPMPREIPLEEFHKLTTPRETDGGVDSQWVQTSFI